ncbi:hypothetical protein JCM1840_007491 [Sporobolomyces johnsonii]
MDVTITHTQACHLDRVHPHDSHGAAPGMRYRPWPIRGSALPGHFSLGVNAWGTAYTLSWRGVKCPLQIRSGWISLSEVSEGGAAVAALDIWGGYFPPAPAGELEIPFETFIRSVYLTVSLEPCTKPDETCTKQDEQAVAVHALAARSAASIVHRSHNVCFEFPRTSRRLWSNEENLRKLSAYYNSLLSPDFAEGSTSSQAVPSSSSLPDYTYDDSDAETDELELGCKAKSKKGEEQDQHEEQDQKKESGGAPFKTVTIVDTAYTTYFAVLVWISTGYIRFAPLRSKFRSDGRGVKQARAAELDKMISQSDSELPPPASPKSVYRLAHLLELPDLLQLALDDFKSQLSSTNIAYELYSDVSCCYEAIRDIALEFAAENWKEVSEAEGTREMERRACAGELPRAASGVSMLLARNLLAKYGECNSLDQGGVVVA